MVSDISQRHFPKGDFQSKISQVTTFQMCNFPNCYFPKVRLGLQWCHRLLLGPSAAATIGQGPSAYLRSCIVGKFLLGKIPLGSFRLRKKTLGKYLTFKSKERIVKLPRYFPFFQCQHLAQCLKINYVFELVYSTQLFFLTFTLTENLCKTR